MTSAANAASPSSYATEGVTDETLWTDADDPALIPYRRSKTLAERAAWDFIGSHAGPAELVTVLPGAGHLSSLERPAEFTTALADFLGANL